MIKTTTGETDGCMRSSITELKFSFWKLGMSRVLFSAHPIPHSFLDDDEPRPAAAIAAVIATAAATSSSTAQISLVCWINAFRRSARSCCCIWTGWQRRTVFDLVISQAQTTLKKTPKEIHTTFSHFVWTRSARKMSLVLLFKNGLFKKASQFCQFNFIERIYGLAGPPQQLEFVTVPLAPRDLSSSFPFFFLYATDFGSAERIQWCVPLRA